MYVHLWGMAYWPLNEGSPFNAGLKNLRVIQENKSSEISIPQQIDFKLKCPPLLLFFSSSHGSSCHIDRLIEVKRIKSNLWKVWTQESFQK